MENGLAKSGSVNIYQPVMAPILVPEGGCFIWSMEGSTWTRFGGLQRFARIADCRDVNSQDRAALLFLSINGRDAVCFSLGFGSFSKLRAAYVLDGTSVNHQKHSYSCLTYFVGCWFLRFQGMVDNLKRRGLS